jgi:hypothetical protein
VGIAMNEIKFGFEWWDDGDCTYIRGVATFDTNMTWAQWHDHEGEESMEIKRETVILKSLQLPFKKLGQEPSAWRDADQEEIDHLMKQDEFYEELELYWIERSDDE